MKVVVIVNHAPTNISNIIKIESTDYVIAVDGGFDIALKQKIKIDLIVGDMDSIQNKKKNEEYELLKYNSIKDQTDTYLALEKAYSISNNIFLIGGIQGNRIEHFLANLTLFKKFPKLMILDENSKIYILKDGKHLIQKGPYVSFFSTKDVELSLTGFKYPLTKYVLKLYDPLCISNEIIKTYAEVEIKNGPLLVIESKKNTK